MFTNRYIKKFSLSGRAIAAAAAIGAMAFAATPAQAVPIVGSISMNGGVTMLDSSNNTTVDPATAVALDFNPAGTGGSFTTVSADGDFTGAASTGTITDFTFNPFSGPINDFWSVVVGANTFYFDLTGISIVHQGSDYLTLSGSGTMHATGYDNTAGIFSFTSQSPASAGVFSFSASSSVPEPAPLALLGLGLVALAVANKKRKEAADL